MKNDITGILVVILLILIGVLIGTGGFAVIGGKTPSVWHNRIIEHNCGQYNSTTGDFEWKESK